MATKPVYYTVSDTIVGTLDGAEVEYHMGEVVEADDPAVKKWPSHFVPLVVRAHRSKVEQATASPGEKRA
jgi:hypothetical protein